MRHRLKRMRRPTELIRPIISILQLIRIRNLPLLNMRLEPLVKIPHTKHRRHHRQHQRNQRQDRKNRQTPPSRLILQHSPFRGVVHAHQLEDEVGHAGEVDDDDDDLPGVGFAAGEEGGEEEEDDGYGEGGDGEPFFEVGGVGDHDEELDGEA